MFSERTKGVTIVALLPVAHALPVFRFSLSNTNMDGYLSQYHDRNRQMRHLNPHIKHRLSSFTQKAQPTGTSERSHTRKQSNCFGKRR
jgi:hypothetical protein